MTFQSISKRNILFVTFFAFCNFPKNMGQKPVTSLLNQATWAPSAGEVNQLQLTASSVVFNHIHQDIDISWSTFFLTWLHNRTQHNHPVLFFCLIKQLLFEGATCGRSLHAHAGKSILFLHDKRSDAVLRILPTRYVTKLCSPSSMSVSNARQ